MSTNVESSKKPVKHPENPFYGYIPDMKMKMSSDELTISKIVNQDTGEIQPQTFQGNVAFEMKIDCNARFVKIITENMGLISSLPLGARRLLDVVMIVVQMEAKDKDYFYMSYETAKYISEGLGFNLSQSMFYKSIGQLMDGKLIAPSLNRTRYWLNIGVILNGDYRKLEGLKKNDAVHFCEKFNSQKRNKRIAKV